MTPRQRSGRRSGRRRVAGRLRPVRARRTERAARNGRLFIPSAITVLAICAGLTAMRTAADDGNVDLALILLVTAAVLDGLDGRVARMMDASSAIGAELDSLADVINFGVVPAVMVYSILLREQSEAASGIGWALVLVYCSAIVLRLARFNTLLDDDSAPGYTRDFFVGVPAPAAAVMVLLPVGLLEQFGEGWWTSTAFVGCWLVFIGLLAVSRVPTLSLKSAKPRARLLAPGLFIVAGAAALLFTFPYVLMIVLVGAYLLHIPFAWRMQRWVSSRPEHWETAPRDRRLQRRDERRAEVAAGTRRRVIPVRRPSARLGLRVPTGPSKNDAPH
ncbi:phosphatidylcholine/phosphatidylserine synthase [Gordonia alkaliphila]|uniref:CDP-diacylglycerol--serine O-phosphatidyltransferase n=1 Tax=Gordonia alkaliphila TaxID=1053547 RepID=A0ABP8ZG03_9ACTN